MSKLNIKSFFGDRSFYKEVTGIALPIMAQQFVTSFVNLIDNVMVGGIGQTAALMGIQAAGEPPTPTPSLRRRQ